jgi:hypothetical protein
VPLDAEFWKRSDPTDARDALVETLRYDLLGPLEADEELDESPLTRYLVGTTRWSPPLALGLAPETTGLPHYKSPAGTQEATQPDQTAVPTAYAT